DSYVLCQNGHPGYWSDLKFALQKLKFPVELPSLPDLTSEACLGLAKSVYISAMKFLDAEVSASTRLYMLHGRREPLDGEPAKKITVVLRHYLTLVENARHRKALTRLLVSQHPLAVERMRYKQRYHREHVPRDERRCRFGCNSVETVEHTLFFCSGTPRLEEQRETFLEAMRVKEPRVLSIFPWNATNILKSLIFRRDTVCQVAKFVCKVFAEFDAVPMVWPVGA
ncbi:hypothetical protein DFH09DRAFT_900274, partial [Mycena vulgaris]